jgi:hypothetical protein
MIKNITGIEASILNNFYELLGRDDRLGDITKITDFYLEKEQIIKSFGIDEGTYQVSIYNLMRMQCIGPAIIKSSISIGNEAVTAYKGTDAIVLTPLGVRFVEACLK